MIKTKKKTEQNKQTNKQTMNIINNTVLNSLWVKVHFALLHENVGCKDKVQVLIYFLLTAHVLKLVRKVLNAKVLTYLLHIKRTSSKTPERIFPHCFLSLELEAMLIFVFIIFTEVYLTLQRINGLQIDSLLGSFRVSQQMKSELFTDLERVW